MSSSYEKVASESDNASTERLLNEESHGFDTSSHRHSNIPIYRRAQSWTIVNAIMLCISVIFFISAYLQSHPSELEMLKRTSFYSPIWDSIKLSTHDKIVSGELWTANPHDKYRNYLKPNKTVNDAWEELENIRVFPITEDQLRKLGKDPELSVKFPPSYGLGDNMYAAQIDMYHQLHCLNLLRYQAWKEYDRNATLRRKPYSPIHWVHVSHCTDILLKNIMCSGSLDIVTFTWLETQTNPWPDFNVAHKCRSVDDIAQWQEEHSVPLTWGRNITRPEGAKQIPMPDIYYTLMNQTKAMDHETDHHHSH